MDEYVEIEELKKVAPKFLQDLRNEQTRLTEDFPICAILIEEAFDRFFSTGLLPGDENYADGLNQKPIKLTQKVLVPSKIMALKRSYLTSLQDETQCEILIKGKNSMVDHEKEDKLRQSGDPQYNHLNKNMFLEISTLSTPIECYSRVAYALTEIRKYLTFDQNDVSHEELLEIEIIPEVIDYTEQAKQLNQVKVTQDPLLVDLGFKQPAQQSIVLEKPQIFENKPNFISIANKLIKLLDETVLNPNFQRSEDTNMSSSNIDTLTNFIVSKPSTNSSPISINENIEDIPLSAKLPTASKFTQKIRSRNRDQKLDVPKICTIKRTKLQNSTNSNKTKSNKEKPISVKRARTKNCMKIKKDNSPGLFYLKDKKSNKIIKHRILIKSALYRCLRRCKNESIEPEEGDNYKPMTIERLQEKPSELVFEYTPREVIISFLEGMKNYPVLWEFHDKPFNEDYNKAIEELCKIINVEWSLTIDSLKMRRSITRVLRFYRYLFPFECIDKFADYFNKCAGFLPSEVIKIPHARCSHCFICYKEDFELKKHLLEKHNSLKWRYKCQYCMESFREFREYEFHKRLPHYVEVFTCNQCHKRFHNKFSYNRHLDCHEQKLNIKPRNYICDECGKDFKTNGELRGHKAYHGEKKMKCHLCPKSYFKNTSLMLHLKTHRKELDFICEMCGNGFICERNLKDHMDTHMRVQITCTICGLKLRKRNLYRHLRTIHVACEGTLEETFRAKGHNHKRYTQVRSSNRSDRLKRAKRSIEKHERQYDCKTCNINFDRLKFLKDHNKECHYNVQKIPCKICSSELSYKQNLKRHYREKHKLHDDQVVAIMEKNEDINTVLEMKSRLDLEQLKKQRRKSDLSKYESFYFEQEVQSKRIKVNNEESNDDNTIDIQAFKIDNLTYK